MDLIVAAEGYVGNTFAGRNKFDVIIQGGALNLSSKPLFLKRAHTLSGFNNAKNRGPLQRLDE